MGSLPGRHVSSAEVVEARLLAFSCHLPEDRASFSPGLLTVEVEVAEGDAPVAPYALVLDLPVGEAHTDTDTDMDTDTDRLERTSGASRLPTFCPQCSASLRSGAGYRDQSP